MTIGPIPRTGGRRDFYPGRFRQWGDDSNPTVTAWVIVVALLAIGRPVPAAAAPEIVTWAANTPEWNQRLGVTLTRQGCSADPEGCLRSIRASAKSQQISRWALAVKREVNQWPDDALEYSQRSLSEPLIVAVDIDDFLGALKAWHVSTLGQANRVLDDVTRNLKYHNPRLRFGITLYEDELDSPLIALIPVKTRERVDRVSLYLHYRANAGNYGGYVEDARRLFPRAEIWAGSYAYDRIDYLPCAESGSRPCGRDEEVKLFGDSLRIQLDLLRQGHLAGIEFYPGFFGREDQWHGWGIERICRPQRRRDCIENTLRMREIVAEEFARWRRPARSSAEDSH
jgi:hypothetical protein